MGETIISIHLHRTGGKSFQKTLSDAYHNRFLLDRLGKYAPGKSKRYEIVHGHFPVKKYYTPGAKLIIWLRKPEDRIVSYYKFAKYKNKVNYKSFEDYLMSPESEMITGELERYLEGFSIKDFFFVGLVERYEKDLDRLSQMLGKELTPCHINSFKKYEKVKITESIKSIINERMSYEIDVYNSIVN